MKMTWLEISVNLINMFLILCQSSALELKKISVLEVPAVEGKQASLPCDISHPSDDNIFLLLFFNDNLTTPIYRHDIRPGVRDSVSHWVDSEVLGDRAQLVVADRVAELKIFPVRSIDEGFYKCRVDFRKYPTRTTRISLRVIVPPKTVKIIQDGRDVKTVIGPFQEGESTSLQCYAISGRPTPHITWYFGDTVLDSQMDIPEDNAIFNETKTDHKIRTSSLRRLHKTRKVSNTLHLGPFTRNDMMRSITCKASNTNLTAPLTEHVKIDMNLPPLSLDIAGPTEAVSAGRNYTFVCQVVGSRPPPSITWLKGSMRIQGTSESTSADGNVTKSSVVLIPTPPDDGTTVTCRAQNSETKTTMQKSIALTVYFVPEAVVNLASFLNPENIKEGDDVYFECIITSNPKVYKLSWHHNGRLLEANKTGGLIVSNHSLVLQKVERRHGGKYSCTASNIEGDGLSASVDLDIKYAPVCAPDQVTTYGIAKQEDAEVTCEVNSNPKAKSFKWTFNNTADTIDVPPGKYTTTPESSIITYTPVTELDFGTLLCWAVNAIGTQITPCVFHIVPAGRPDPPTNCSIVNKTSISFGVWCQPGFDGGLQQVFLISVSTAGGRGLNYSNGLPYFKIENLSPGNSYRLQVWSVNDKGSSVPVHLNAFTLNAPPGPSEAEVREGYGGRESSPKSVVGPSIPSKEDLDEGVSNKKMLQEDAEWHWQIAGTVPAIAGAMAGGILILVLTAFLVHYKVRRCGRNDGGRTLDDDDNNAHSHCQSSSATMLFHARHSEVSDTCHKRDLQIDTEDVFDRDHVVGVDVDATGPLIQPPTCYGGDTTIKNLYQQHSRKEDPNSPPHRLISHLQEKRGIVTYHSSTAGIAHGTSPQQFSSHHHALPSKLNKPEKQHVPQNNQIKPQVSQFNSMSPAAPSMAVSVLHPHFQEDVPTVYATLGSRAFRMPQSDTLRHAHSQVSLQSHYDHHGLVRVLSPTPGMPSLVPNKVQPHSCSHQGPRASLTLGRNSCVKSEHTDESAEAEAARKRESSV